ncbi:hypothetical protein [Desulfobacter latus]|uniref:Uncharacterized protein n=1 Tax=Desulfobacter latus TaxID=2292 RepID=A0A850T793_9BACT|nr:hypothetical protein [Desulfobacter latus]NWH06971.1 hypothetical protein [Desulfobacter latus]
MKDNSFTDISDPQALQEAAQEIQENIVQQRINYWMDRFFKKDNKAIGPAGRRRAST